MTPTIRCQDVGKRRNSPKKKSRANPVASAGDEDRNGANPVEKPSVIHHTFTSSDV
jgi:hypothetical protein